MGSDDSPAMPFDATASPEASSSPDGAGRSGGPGRADGAAAPVERECPRCGASLAGERYYGPCGPCREALRAAYAGRAHEVEAAAYEPKMNVTPNAVALKE